MPVSLRLVIGFSTALIVLVVAAATLAITYTVSVSAVRSAGTSLSDAIVSHVALQVQEYVGMPEKHLYAFRAATKTYNVVLPYDDPGYATEAWGYRWRSLMQGFALQANYSYSSIALIVDDGSMIVSIDYQYTRGWASDIIQTWRNRTLPNGTIQFYPTIENHMFNIATKQPWNETLQGPMPATVYPMDGRLGAYVSVLQLNAYQEKCLWLPPQVDNNEYLNPRYLLYGMCILKNSSNTLFGSVLVGRFLDNINDYLEGTSKTPNTHLIVVDSFKLLVASTYSVPPVVYHNAPYPVKANCVSSSEVSSAKHGSVIGCREYATDYPFAPLQSIAQSNPAFLTLAGRQLVFGSIAGENYYYATQRIESAMAGYTLNLLLFMPETDILGNIVEGRNIAIGVTAGIFVLAAILSFALVGLLLAPIDEVARRMYYTSQLTSEKEQHRLQYLEDGVTALPRDDQSSAVVVAEDASDTPLQRSNMIEIRALQAAYNTMDTAIKSFTRYVPRDVVKELMATNQMCEIQMRPMRCSMLFTDIAGFTSICERIPTPILSSLVRLYFERSSQIVMQHGGVIDKFIGDCIMAVWGAPIPINHHELRAAICGRMLVHETEQDVLKTAFANVNETLNIRVGVSSGEVLAGNMGSQVRMNYTVIGDDVNLASRLEGLNKQWGTSVMLSENTAEECVDYLHMRYIISIAVVGKAEAVKVYEMVGVREDVNLERLGTTANDVSEAVTQLQAQQDEDFKMMEERYGVKKKHSNGANLEYATADQPLHVGRLVRRCLRKAPVSEEQIAFCRMYETAVGHWDRGEFAACRELLKASASDSKRQCVANVMHAAERHLQSKEAPGPSWTGVWIATEK